MHAWETKLPGVLIVNKTDFNPRESLNYRGFFRI